MAKSAGLIPTATVQGLSLGILMRFNIDITPAGILKVILPGIRTISDRTNYLILPPLLTDLISKFGQSWRNPLELKTTQKGI